VEGSAVLSYDRDEDGRVGPTMACDPVDTLWHPTDVVINCTATDPVSGLESASDSNSRLQTTVPLDTETADAPTDSRTECDVAGNCVLAGPFRGNRVDKTKPAITISTPVPGKTYQKNTPSRRATCAPTEGRAPTRKPLDEAARH
jgi:hypothetical protein